LLSSSRGSLKAAAFKHALLAGLQASLGATAKAVTGHAAKGWLFWRPAEGGEQ